MFKYKERVGGTMFMDCELKKHIGDFRRGSKFYMIEFVFNRNNLELVFYNTGQNGDPVEVMRRPLVLVDTPMDN